MPQNEWTRRLAAAGLSQAALADILGHARSTINRQLHGRFTVKQPPRHVIAAIVAWELMSDEQREAWQAELDRSG
jgi:IS30 family transposase